MKRFDKVQILKNVGSSWFALGLNIVVGIFLSPYILHRLGDDAFGLWILIFSVTGYYGIFDLGIRSSIIRYVAKYAALEHRDQLNRLVNTAMIAYLGVGLLTMSITVVGSFYLTSIFRVPTTFLATARLLFLMVGISVALSFPLGVFGGILEGLQRFYVLNFTNISSTVLRALLVVIALRRGHGLLAVAFITVLLPLIGALVNAAIILRILLLRLNFQYFDRATLRRIANYSGTTFIIIVATRLRFKADAVIIGTFLSSAAITYFTIGSRLVDYAGEVVGGLAQIFVPMSSQLQAAGDMDRLRKIFVAGNRACALVIFPVTAILIILGKSIIEAWVGAKYVAASYPVLLILLIPSTLMLAQSASGRILWGMAKHRTWAWVVLIEGSANLILSILLVRHFGVIGDAMGTAIPLTCTMLFFLPRHVCRLLNIPLRSYLSQAFTLPLALCAPLVLVLLWMRHWFVAHNYFKLAIQLVIGCLVYGAGLLWVFLTNRAWKVEPVSGTKPEQAVPLALIETFPRET